WWSRSTCPSLPAGLSNAWARFPRPSFCPGPVDSAAGRRHAGGMDTSSNPASQPGGDRHRILRAFNASLAFVFLLLVVFVSQPALDVGALAVSPRDLGQWLGLLAAPLLHGSPDRKSTRLNSSHVKISYAVFCL